VVAQIADATPTPWLAASAAATLRIRRAATAVAQHVAERVVTACPPARIGGCVARLPRELGRVASIAVRRNTARLAAGLPDAVHIGSAAATIAISVSPDRFRAFPRRGRWNRRGIDVAAAAVTCIH